MKIGIYTDPHITKNMRSLQDIWEDTTKKSIYKMYDHFDNANVDFVVCAGDFFDAPRLEAKHMNLVLPLLDSINKRNYSTYLLLGNHEIDSDESNILEFLNSYENIHPVTELTEIEGIMFIPYNMDLESVDVTNKIVFTHHDIYGSELAGGKVKAFFGTDPTILSKSKYVFNGHVHLKSQVAKNIMNLGSFLISQQGELKLGDHPQYYILDSNDLNIESYDNKESMIYLTIDEDESDKLINSGYDLNHCVLRVEYEGEIPDVFLNTAHTSWKKKIDNIDISSTEKINHTNFDLKNYLVEYIKGDSEVPDSDKDNYINLGLRLLS